MTVQIPVTSENVERILTVFDQLRERKGLTIKYTLESDISIEDAVKKAIVERYPQFTDLRFDESMYREKDSPWVTVTATDQQTYEKIKDDYRRNVQNPKQGHIELSARVHDETELALIESDPERGKTYVDLFVDTNMAEALDSELRHWINTFEQEETVRQ